MSQEEIDDPLEEEWLCFTIDWAQLLKKSEHYNHINNLLSAIEDGSVQVITTTWDKDKELHMWSIEFPRTELEEEDYQKGLRD